MNSADIMRLSRRRKIEQFFLQRLTATKEDINKIENCNVRLNDKKKYKAEKETTQEKLNKSEKELSFSTKKTKKQDDSIIKIEKKNKRMEHLSLAPSCIPYNERHFFS